jgi:predicted GIY-YIG superfamily endonuclease
MRYNTVRIDSIIDVLTREFSNLHISDIKPVTSTPRQLNINKYTDRGCVYFIKLLDHTNKYKYGCTKNIKKRLRDHKYNKSFGRQKLIDIVDCDVFERIIEDKVKKLAINNHELTNIDNHVEIIDTTDINQYIYHARIHASSYHGYIVNILDKL